MPKFQYTNEGRRPLLHTVRIDEDTSEHDDDVNFDSFTENLLKNESTKIVTNDRMATLSALVAQISRLFRFEEATLTTRSTTFQHTILDDRLIRLVVDHVATDLTGKLSFNYVDFRLTDIECWYQLLRIIKVKSMAITNCRLNSLNIFSEDVVMRGLTHLDDIKIQYTTSNDVENVDVKHFLRKDSISSLQLFLAIDCNEIINKLKRYLKGDFFLKQLIVEIKESDKERLHHYLDTISKGRSERTYAEFVEYNLITENAKQKGNVSIIDHYGVWRFQFQVDLNNNVK